MLDYAQTHIFDAVTTCGHYQGRLLLILILHSVMHDVTSTLPVGVNPPLGFNAKWPHHVNRRRAPGVIRLGSNGYDTTIPLPIRTCSLLCTRLYLWVVQTKLVMNGSFIVAAWGRILVFQFK